MRERRVSEMTSKSLDLRWKENSPKPKRSNSLNPQRARKDEQFFPLTPHAPRRLVQWCDFGAEHISCVCTAECTKKLRAKIQDDDDDVAAHKIGHHEELMWATTANKTRRGCARAGRHGKCTGIRTDFYIIAPSPAGGHPYKLTGTKVATQEKNEKRKKIK